MLLNDVGLTYGGIRELQRYIRNNLFPMLTVEIINSSDISYVDRYINLISCIGTRISIDEEILKHGAMGKVAAARFIKKDSFWLCFDGNSIVIGEGCAYCSLTLRNFLKANNHNLDDILNISRYGIPNPTEQDKLEFNIYPKIYEERIFNKQSAPIS